MRDYWQEIEATVTSKLSTWKLQHLGIWADVVEPEAAPAAKVHSAAELLEIEGECQAAKFREVRAKVAQDIADMTQYNSSLKESERRAHVVTVMHERGQVQIGKELLVTSFVCRLMPFVLFNLCLLGFGIPFKATFLDVSGKRLSENFMEKVCRVSLVTDKQPCDPKVEAVYRQAAANFKALVAKAWEVFCFCIFCGHKLPSYLIQPMLRYHRSRPVIFTLWSTWIAPRWEY